MCLHTVIAFAKIISQCLLGMHVCKISNGNNRSSSECLLLAFEDPDDPCTTSHALSSERPIRSGSQLVTALNTNKISNHIFNPFSKYIF